MSETRPKWKKRRAQIRADAHNAILNRVRLRWEGSLQIPGIVWSRELGQPMVTVESPMLMIRG